MNTAHDLVDLLLTSVGGGAQDGEHRAVRQAVVQGVQEVLRAKNWLWHVKTGSFVTNEITTTAYVAKGIPYVTVASTTGFYAGRVVEFGASGIYATTPRVVQTLANNVVEINQAATSQAGFAKAATTVSGSAVLTFANNTDFDKIIVNAIVSVGEDGTNTTLFTQPVRVLSKNAGNNTVTLSGNATATNATPVTFNFGQPFSALPQTFYDLPADVKDIDALVSDTVGTLHQYLTPQEWQRLEVNTRGAGEPYYYTIMRSDLYPDRYQVRFVGVPANRTLIFYTYRYIPESVKYMGYEQSTRQGTVAPAAGSPMTVVGNGTAFTADMVGSVIRVGTVSTEPEPIGGLVPFVGEAKITAVNTATQTLTIDGTLPTTAGVKYCITDVIDCSPQMFTACLSGTQMWYARLAGRPAADVVALFNRDLRLAMENDVVSPMSGRPKMIEFPTARSRGWKSALTPDRE